MAVRRLLIAAEHGFQGPWASVVVAYGLSSGRLWAPEHRLRSCAQAQLPRGMQDLPGPGIEPVSPAFAGLTTGLPDTYYLISNSLKPQTIGDYILPQFIDEDTKCRELKQCPQGDTTKEQERELPTQVGWKTSARHNGTLLPALSHREVGEKRPAGTLLCLIFVLFLQGASVDSFWVFNMLLLANLNQVPGQCLCFGH